MFELRKHFIRLGEKSLLIHFQSFALHLTLHLIFFRFIKRGQCVSRTHRGVKLKKKKSIENKSAESHKLSCILYLQVHKAWMTKGCYF